MLTQAARKVASELATRVRCALNIPVTRDYAGFSIQFPPESRIAGYQRAHPRYDRFLPRLARYLSPGEAVIDVGANVGDTLAGMVEQNDQLTFLCVEADTGYFDRLQENICRIREARPALNVRAVKALVGENVKGAFLVDNRGTKNAVVQEGGGLNSQSLDGIVKGLPDLGRIRLVKSDVDGFDYDVLDSALRTLRKHKSMVFFECQIDTEAQKEGYQNTFRRLADEGYSDWTLFDNFGEIVIRTRDLNVISQLLRYVWQQNLDRSTRTIYYYDVLIVQAQDEALITSVLTDYLS